MIKNLSYFEESVSKRKIAINSRLVRLIIEIDEKTVAVVFDKEHQIVIDGTLAGVSDHIREAMD